MEQTKEEEGEVKVPSTIRRLAQIGQNHMVRGGGVWWGWARGAGGWWVG